MTLRLPAAWAGAAAGAAVLLAGCTPLDSGVGPTASASPSAEPTISAVAVAPAGTPDPCAMIVLDKLNSVLDTTMAEGVFDSGLSYDGRNICGWAPKDDQKTEPRVQVEINWEYPDATRHRKIAADLFGKTIDIKPIKNAKDAYALPGKRTIGMSVGDYFVKVSFTQPDRRKGDEITRELAGIVAKNLTKYADATGASGQ
ncbi:hypothetical protein [Demequina soli]|uniref:hypothetical protein n=1 Tax=Demequina soli TaxID=1638987 RepID=UPI0007840523|nr:hypothetical protein [Demequina soli]